MGSGGSGAPGSGFWGVLGRGDPGSRRLPASLGTLAWRPGTLGQWCWEEAVKVAQGVPGVGGGEDVLLSKVRGTVLNVKSE